MSESASLKLPSEEFRKRRREILTVISLSLLFLILTWFEVKLFGISQELPFVHSVFFFGLVNFNIILLLLLLFLIFRNVVKVFVDRKGTASGASLKAKLVVSFLGFSVVPTLLMFVISVFYINSSFDKWFSEKMSGVLRSSLEVTNEFYSTAKKRSYHYGNEIAKKISEESSNAELKVQLSEMLGRFHLDAVEFFQEGRKGRIMATPDGVALPEFPEVEAELLEKGLTEGVEASAIQNFKEGNVVRVIVPVKHAAVPAAVVVSSYIPLSLISRMDDIAAAYEDFKDLNPLEYPLKSIYLIILVLMTLVILLSASWFGFYLAKNITIPLELLGKATRRISRHRYDKVNMASSSKEINELIDNFNQMSEELSRSEVEIVNINSSLDEHNRYMEVVLSNVSTGVIAVDSNGFVTMMNRHAADLLEVDPNEFVGRSVKDLLSHEYMRIFVDLVKTMKRHQATNLKKEFRVRVGERTVPMQMSLSLLKDEEGRDLGRVLAFDDLTVLVSAQRAAAWREVARRIAHEIKNPLTPIKLSAQRLQKKFSEQIKDPAFEDATTMIINEVDGLKNLVNEFSNFARMPEVRPVKGSMNKTARDAVTLFEIGHKDCEFVFDLDEKLPEFEFDPDQMKRVLSNLLDNAVSASKQNASPRIVVQTKFDKLLGIVQISVTDNGEPQSHEVMEHLFEPYFSTKENGTGLGLSIVKRVVEDHNGFVRARQVKPQGMQILLELPVVVVQNTDWLGRGSGADTPGV